MRVHYLHFNKLFFITVYIVKRNVLQIPGLLQQAIWHVLKIIGFQLFISEKLKQILNIFMLIYVIKIFSFLIVCATIE